MIKENSLELLPLNFRHEKKFLLKSKFNTWSKLRKLEDIDINFIINKNPLCTESRLKKIRAISIFIHELEITPPQAYMLLHCGISSIKALSVLDAHVIEKRIGRLERGLQVKTKVFPSFLLLKGLIKKAKKIIER
tara:strand:- start:12672 stop:13076 length:405 start_codon:yes stop_codon:yes gene_type:complete